MAEPVRRLATYADLEAVPEHLVAEIIDGMLYASPMLTPSHGAAATALVPTLHSAFRQDGWVFACRPKLHLGPQMVVPDLAGWRGDRVPAGFDAPFVVTPPDWVCEVLSPATARLDRGPKRRIYAEGCVGHLWLLDANDGLLEGFSLTRRRQWLLNDTPVIGEAVALPPFDAISFPLDDLFAFDDPAPTAAPES